MKGTSSRDRNREAVEQIKYSQIALEIASKQPQLGAIRLKIISGSMRPILRPGDIIAMTPLSGENALRRGDIIVFQQSETADVNLPLTHRLIGKSVGGWLAKGDFRLFPDAPVRPEAVLGKVITIQRGQRQYNLGTSGWRLVNCLMGWGHFMLAKVVFAARHFRRSFQSREIQ